MSFLQGKYCSKHNHHEWQLLSKNWTASRWTSVCRSVNLLIFRKAVCMACQTYQMIPANSSKFYCYECKSLCLCHQKPKNKVPCGSAKKIFICGSCSVKVQYNPDQGRYFRCSKCQMVNAVPKWSNQFNKHDHQ